MSESGNKDEGTPPKKTPKDERPPSFLSSLFRWILLRIRNLPKFLQDKTSDFLQWFSEVLEEAGDWKKVLFVLIKRAVRAIARWVAGMSPLHFVCLLGVLVIAISYAVMQLNSDQKSSSKTSGPIILCFSAMGANTDPNMYISNEADEAIQEITARFDIFDVRICKSDEIVPDDNDTVLNVLVGCYVLEEREGTVTKELRIRIPKLLTYQKKYGRLSPFSADDVARKIKESILAKYPPVGLVKELQPPQKERPPDYPSSQPRIAILNVGRLSGVRRDDIFEFVDPNKAGLFSHARTIQIWDVSPMRSMAHVSWEQEIKVGWCVKWKKAGL